MTIAWGAIKELIRKRCGLLFEGSSEERLKSTVLHPFDKISIDQIAVFLAGRYVQGQKIGCGD